MEPEYERSVFPFTEVKSAMRRRSGGAAGRNASIHTQHVSRATVMLDATRTVLLLTFTTVATSLSSGLGPDPHTYGIIDLPSLLNNSHNLVLGWRQYGDSLIHRQLLRKEYMFGRLHTDDITFPPVGEPREKTITHVLALDQSDGNGFANLTAGGIGRKTVSIRLRSKRSRTLNYVVEVYGK